MREHLLEVTGIDRAEWLYTNREHALVKRMTEKLQAEYPKATTAQEVLFEHLVWYQIVLNRIKNKKTTMAGIKINPKNMTAEDVRMKQDDWAQWPQFFKAQMEVIKQLQGGGLDINVNSSVGDLFAAFSKKEKDGDSPTTS